MGSATAFILLAEILGFSFGPLTGLHSLGGHCRQDTGFLGEHFFFVERANFLGATEGGGSFTTQIWEREGTFFHQRARFLAKRARFLRVFLCPSRVSFPLGPLFCLEGHIFW